MILVDRQALGLPIVFHEENRIMTFPSPERRLSFTRAELAKAANLCEKTVAAHEHPRGNLKFILIGKRGKRYLAADVDAWLASLRCDAPAGGAES